MMPLLDKLLPLKKSSLRESVENLVSSVRTADNDRWARDRARGSISEHGSLSPILLSIPHYYDIILRPITSIICIIFFISARKEEGLSFLKKARDTFTYHPGNKIKMIIASSEELIMRSQLKIRNYLRGIDDSLTYYTLRLFCSICLFPSTAVLPTRHQSDRASSHSSEMSWEFLSWFSSVYANFYAI